MLASLGVYWTLYGWPLALGLVLSIYVHEMGHVAMIRRYGSAASAPMFIPGFGAFIQLRAMNLPPVPDSRMVSLVLMRTAWVCRCWPWARGVSREFRYSARSRISPPG